MNIKLKAYTLLEITIAMLLSAIVISMTYAIVNIISGTLNNFIKKNTAVTMVTQLDRSLNRDFARGVTVVKDGEYIRMKMDTDSVVYAFEPGLIIRRSFVADTFAVNPGSVSASFEGKPVNSPQHLVDDLQFDSSLENRVIHHHYFKNYSSSELFKADSNAINRPKKF